MSLPTFKTRMTVLVDDVSEQGSENSLITELSLPWLPFPAVPEGPPEHYFNSW